MNRNHLLSAGLALFLVMACCIGCGGSSESTAERASVAEEAAASEQMELSPDQEAEISRVVRIAKAIDSDRARALEILSAEGITPQEWSDALGEIAADPAMAVAYNAAMGD